MPGLDVDVAQSDFSLISANMSEEFDNSLDMETLAVGRQHKGAYALIHFGEDDTVIGNGGISGPYLSARYAPAVAVWYGLGLQSTGIGTCIGLRQPKTHGFLA